MKKSGHLKITAAIALLVTAAIFSSVMAALGCSSFALDNDAADDTETADAEIPKSEIRSALLEYIYSYEYSVSLSNRIELAQGLYDDAYHQYQKDEKNEAELDVLGKAVEELNFEYENKLLELQKLEIKLRNLSVKVNEIEDAEKLLATVDIESLDEEKLNGAAYDNAVEVAAKAKLEELKKQREAEKAKAEAEAMKNQLNELAAAAETTAETQPEVQTVNGEVTAVSENQTETSAATKAETTKAEETHNGEFYCDCPICRAARETETEPPSFRPFNPFAAETTTAEPETTTAAETSESSAAKTTSATSTVATSTSVVQTTAETTKKTADTVKSEAETTEPEIEIDPETLGIDREKLAGEVSLCVVELKISYNELLKAVSEYASAADNSEQAFLQYKKGLLTKSEYYSFIDKKYSLRAEVYRTLCEYCGKLFALDDLCPQSLELSEITELIEFDAKTTTEITENG